MQTFKNDTKLLEYLNDTYSRLHKRYEDAFWLYRMGDFSYGDIMNKRERERDAFRSSVSLKKTVEEFIKKAKRENKKRLELWKHFFGLYTTSPEALPVREKLAELENKVLQKRSEREEGYIDPFTNSFVKATENEMRIIMRTHPQEEIRKACFESMEKLPLSTLSEYVEIIKLRNEFARLLGYEDFYDYKIHIDEGMSKKELFKIFDDLYEKTKYAHKNIRDLEQKMENEEGKRGLRKPWNFSYFFTGDFTKEEDPYFKFENVLSYWGTSFAAMGIDFKNGDMKLDLLDRKGKWNNGFCHYPQVVYEKNKKLIPGSCGFTSTANPFQVGSGFQGLHTVFHEAGHAADRLNSRQKDVCINTEYPPSTVSWAETQSMFMDAISSSIEWKMRYAKNSQGEAYPFELFERKLKKIHPLLPLEMMHIARIVFFEKEIYEAQNLTEEFVLETARKIYKKCFDYSEDSLAILNTPHIYSFESSAYYHGYGIAELGVYQWRDYFFKKYKYIVDNPRVGKELMKIWSYGSLYPARTLIKMATGKALSPNSFIKHVTKSYDEILKNSKKKISYLEKIPKFKKAIQLKANISLVDGKEKIADNKKSFEHMNEKYKKWVYNRRNAIG